MLALKNRLKKKKDFDLIFKQGQSFKQGRLYFKFKHNKLESNRFGFIVSKKFSKKAVERNKIKRQIREIVRSKKNKIKLPLDIIITVMPGADDLEKTIDKAFKKINEAFSKNN